MANKAKKTKKPAAKSNDSNVVRIKASSAPSSKKVVAEESAVQRSTTRVVATTKAAKPVKTENPLDSGRKVKKPKTKRGVRGVGVLKSIGGYFKGAWVELRQVRWPTRRATWGLTGAVLIYTAFFVVLVLLLDAGFKFMFEIILGK